MKKHMLAVLTIVFLFSIVNFLRAYDFKYADWDGFQYLSYSKSILFGKDIYLNPIRSPILALLIIPDLMLARLEMILFHLGITALVYLIVFRITKSVIASAFSSLLYGTNWWIISFTIATMSDLPAMFFFLFGFWLWLDVFDKTRGSKSLRKKLFYSGLFSGIAFLIRFDIAVLLIPLILLTPDKRQNLKYFLFPFLTISIVIELLMGYFAFGNWIYSPYEFYKVNFIAGLASTIASVNIERGFFYFISKFFSMFWLLSLLALFSLFNLKNNLNKILLITTVFFIFIFGFIPSTDDRIFFVKAIPLFSILAFNFVEFVNGRMRLKNYRNILVFGILIFFVLSNLYSLYSISYPDWGLNKTPCPQRAICTNAPPIINYFCEVKAIDIHQFGSRHVNTNPELDKNSTILYNLARCDYLIYYNISFGYDEPTNELIKSRYFLENKTSFALIYNLKTI